MKFKLTPELLIVAAVAAALGATTTWLMLRPHATTTMVTGEKAERKVLYWTDPMVPGFKSDKPGKSPFMDMQLVPVYEDDAGAGGAPVVTVRPEVTNSLGVRTQVVTRKNGALVVPRDALIRTGFRNSVVLALGEGRFQPVDVVPGAEVGEQIEIRQGLKENDRVVISGQFLIDSEASVRASFVRMAPTDGATPAHQH